MGKRVVIIGGGVSGLAAAWRLAEQGIDIDVIEAGPAVGGLSSTMRQDGYCLDVGPHSLFSEQDWIIKETLDLFDYTLEPMPRTVKFFYNGKYLDYPLTPQGVLLQMGLMPGLHIAISYLKQKIHPRRSATLGTVCETVEDWAIANFGARLYHHFFKPYTEQFWKVPCAQLSSRSIPTHTRMSFMNTLWLLLHRRVVKGNSLVEREALPTYYPRTGFAEIPERMALKIETLRGRVHLNCRATGVEQLPDGTMRVSYDSLGNARHFDADHVISTVTLNSLAQMLTPTPPPEMLEAAANLDYRSLVVLGMTTEKQNILGCGYMYMLDRPYNRIAEMNEFSPETSPPGKNILMVEIPCLADSAAWSTSKQELFDMCIGSLAEDGFLGPGDVQRLFLIKTPAAYPVYRQNYAAHLECVLNHIASLPGLATLGRCGEFMYMDIDQCTIRAFQLADNLLPKLQTNTKNT